MLRRLGHRARPGRPAARAHLRRRRALRVLGVDKDAERLAARARRPHAVQGAGHRRAARRASRRLDAVRARAPTPRGADAIVLTLGTPTFSHIEIDMGDIRSVLDDLLPHLRAGHLLVLRSTVAPGTTEFVAGYLEKHRGFKVGEDVFVAHVPERIAADRFLAEIGTLPCIVGGVGEASGERAARLFEVLGAPIVQTTPVQAELAKIWTNILRYATFALPNLLMMDCERYGANVFDVIDLINRDYPRGGMALPGLHRRHLPAQGLRVLARSSSNAPGMLLAVSRVNESVPLFLVDGIKRRLGDLRERKVAVLGLAFKRDTDDERDSLSHKLIRLLERELADVAVHDPVVATPTASFDEAVARRRRRRRRHEPLAPTRRPRRCRRSPSAPAADCLVVDPWNAFGAAQVFAYANEVRRAARREPRPRHRRRRHDRRGGRAAPAARSRTSRSASPTSARRRTWMREGCEVHTGDLRELDAGARGDRRLHARDPPRRDRRRDRELPQAPVHAHRGQPRALQRRLPGRARRGRRALHLRVVEHGVRARRGVPDAPRTTCPTARRRARPTAGRSSPARSTAAPRTTSTACRSRSAARSTPTGRASCPTPSRASRTPCPT